MEPAGDHFLLLFLSTSCLILTIAVPDRLSPARKLCNSLWSAVCAGFGDVCVYVLKGRKDSRRLFEQGTTSKGGSIFFVVLLLLLPSRKPNLWPAFCYRVPQKMFRHCFLPM